MCGIVGLISKWKSSGLQTTQQKMFYQMLFADLLRGNDATGVIGVMKDGDFGTMKEASDSYTFNYNLIDSKLDKQMYKEGVAYIGHNRAKTVGENKDENAHPFTVDGTFSMVHNGTLSNHKNLADTAVDSHALAITFKNAMDQEDWKTALEDALGKVTGAFAVVWYDQKRDQVCMMRNSQRPLAIVKTATATLFGSEGHLLMWIASRNGEKVEEVLSCKEHTLYTFDMKKTGGDFSETNLFPKTPRGKGYSNGTVAISTTTTVATKKEGSANDAGFKSLVSTFENTAQPLSKNAFKRLRAKLAQKTLSFYVEDYVEGANNKAMVIGYSFSGSYDLCEVRHTVKCIVDMTEFPVEALDEAGQLEGKVSHCEYDAENKQIEIHLTGVDYEGLSNAQVH